MDFKKEINELLDKIDDEWILAQVLKFIVNISR